ncbi:MAG: hypothetical protein ACWGNI_00200 [Desulfobacterales bacterium]
MITIKGTAKQEKEEFIMDTVMLIDKYRDSGIKIEDVIKTLDWAKEDILSDVKEGRYKKGKLSW